MAELSTQDQGHLDASVPSEWSVGITAQRPARPFTRGEPAPRPCGGQNHPFLRAPGRTTPPRWFAQANWRTRRSPSEHFVPSPRISANHKSPISGGPIPAPPPSPLSAGLQTSLLAAPPLPTVLDFLQLQLITSIHYQALGRQRQGVIHLRIPRSSSQIVVPGPRPAGQSKSPCGFGKADSRPTPDFRI